MSALTVPEKRYLAALRELERTRQPFTHRRLCDMLGFSSVARSWQLVEALEAKGYVERGARLTIVSDVPVVTLTGRRELKRAA